MVDYRSESVQLWVLGGEITPDELRSAMGDLERAARSASEATSPASPDAIPALDEPSEESPAFEPGPLPLAAHQFFAGLGFLRDHLWSGTEAGPPALLGFLLCDGRMWALRAGVEVRLDQMTGAPVRVPWHEPAGLMGLSWCEVDGREVWRIECAAPGGTLSAHARPPLTSVIGTMREEAYSDSSTPIGPTLHVLPPSTPDDEMGEAASSPSPTPSPKPRPSRPPREVTGTPPIARRPWLRVPPRTLLFAAAGLLVLALVSLIVWGREPMTRAVVGRYDLALETSPPGATVRVDGKLVAGRTPLTVALEPGEHRVELTYGEYASAVVTVDGRRDETVRRTFAWTGSLAVSSADTTARVRVTLDGRPVGAVPLWQDDVPVGSHRLSFQGEGVRPWEEDVKIKLGQSTRVVAEPVRVPDYGLVTARAERVSSDGVEDIEGASVFVDGLPAGGTPVDLKLSPGPHSVRIAIGPELGPVHLIDVQPGGRFYASTTFGRPAEPAVAITAPKTMARGTAPVIVARLEFDLPLPVRRMRLFTSPAASTRFEATDMIVAREGSRPRGAIAFPMAGLAAGGSVRYYVSIETREGEEYFSEIKTAAITP